MSSRDRLIISSALCAYAVYIALGVIHHEAWRDEWQAINIARAATSLPDLYERLRYEGHPALWYLGIRAVWELFPSLISVQILNGLFALAAAGLVAFLAPWPLWLRLMVAFTGPAAWEYSVKVRSYGLGWLMIVALALVLRRPASRSKPWLIALLAALALNTSIFTGFVAFSLVAGWLWEEFRARRLRPLLPAMAVLAGVAVGTFLLARPYPDAAIGLTPKLIASSNVAALTRVFADALLPCTGLRRTYLAVTLVSATAVGYFCFRSLCASMGARLALACGWLSILSFLAFKIVPKPWHQWHLFLLPFAVAIGFERRVTMPRIALAVLAVLAALGINCGVREYSHDWKTTYSAAKPAAEAITAAGLDHLPIVVSTDFFVSSLAGYLGRPLHDGSCRGESTYVVWRQRKAASGLDAFDCAFELAGTNPEHRSLFVHDAPLWDETLAMLAARYKVEVARLGSFAADPGRDERFATRENYFVYVITKTLP